MQNPVYLRPQRSSGLGGFAQAIVDSPGLVHERLGAMPFGHRELCLNRNLSTPAAAIDLTQLALWPHSQPLKDLFHSLRGRFRPVVDLPTYLS